MLTDSPELKRAIEQVLAGNRDAFLHVVREHSLMLRSYLGSQLHHADEMDDIAQEVFIKAFRNLDQFDTGQNFRAWLRGIARNELLMHFRKVGRRKAHEAKFREEVVEVIRHDLEKRFQCQSNDAIESLLRCIGRLPARLRQVVRSGLEGIKAESLAVELSTTVGAVYNLHYRANAILRKCVRKELD
jgi:RNA polymerase sigma-70 factor (ECF subfamily)